MSALVKTLVWQLKAAKVPEPVMELRFAPPRRWRFDLAWVERMVAVEVEGGVWTRGRHSRGAGMVADMTKYNEATLRGWRVLRVTGAHIDDGSALAWIESALATTRPPKAELLAPIDTPAAQKKEG